MSKAALTNQADRFLVAVFEYARMKNEYPPARDRAWAIEALDCDPQIVTKYKGLLVKNGYLEKKAGHLVPTDKAQKYIADREISEITPFGIINTAVPIYGEVRAGRFNSNDETQVILESMDAPTGNFIRVPDANPHKQTFALKVQGVSMIEEGILEGDYVIVEALNGMKPNSQDMVIATYLPKHLEPTDPDVAIDQDDIVGPTLKIYLESSKKSDYSILGWRKGNDKNPFRIETKQVNFIGRVIGVYRRL